MSSNDDGSDSNDGSDSGPGTREVAQRLLAAEFDDATLSYSESDEERAPNYVVSPTGARINRMFAVGVLTEVESVNENIVRGRVVDATGPFVTYAGQYQPDEQAYLERTTPPEFVALTGKARTFEPEDGDRIYTSVRPESINSVDADTRDRWIVTTAESTLRRVAVMHDALTSDLRGEDLRRALDDADVPTPLAAGIPRAIDHYGTTTAYLEAVRRLAVDTLEVVAGEREEVRGLGLAPGEGDNADLGPLPAGVDLDAAGATVAGSEREGEAGADADAGGSADTGARESAAAGADAASAGSTVDAETAAADADSAAEPAEATDPGETAPTETVADEPDPDAESEAAASAEASSAASTGSTVDTGDGAAEPAEATDPAETGDDLGDFDADAGGSGTDTEDAADATDSDDSDDEEGMYELDEAERREVEDEFGTEFSTGNEVDEPGEADIDVPDAEDVEDLTGGDAPDADAGSGDAATAGAESAASSGSTVDADAAANDAGSAAEPAEATDPAETGDDLGDFDADAGSGAEGSGDEGVAEADADSPDAADVDLESTAVDVMEGLDDGDGADREQVVAALVDRYGVDPDDAEDAIQDALMSGKCYEPAEGRLKAI
jgi:RPA family protein